MIASAILDWLLYQATTVNIKGDSYRLKERRRAGLLRPIAIPEHAEQSAGGVFELSRSGDFEMSLDTVAPIVGGGGSTMRSARAGSLLDVAVLHATVSSTTCRQPPSPRRRLIAQLGPTLL